jgi:adenylate cyclase
MAIKAMRTYAGRSQHAERCHVNAPYRRTRRRPMELKLAAVLATEVAGFRRLLRQGEAATLAALQSHHHALIDRAIARYRGRIVELAIERMLASFEVVVDAMECALEIQRGMARRNLDLPPERRVLLRAGLDHRDVIADRGDLSGHGVEVARFLRDLIEPGGLCISDTVFLQVRKRVKVPFEGLGVHRLEGLPEPVRAIRVASLETAAPEPTRRPWWPWRRPA